MTGHQDIKRISLWSGPRNISTALMYSFAQRSDTIVVDEPLYGFYLSHSDAKNYHPGADEILRTMETNGTKVVESMISRTDSAVLFYKNMTHHLPGLEIDFLRQLVNVILTRDPIEMLPSYADVIETPTIDDVGYRMHVELFEELRSKDIPVIVVDSADILKDPKSYLLKLCDAIGIPFDPAMLSWEAGPRPEDGSWAPYWYKNVHKSTGFQPYIPKTKPFPDHLRPLLDECKPYYEKLTAHKL